MLVRKLMILRSWPIFKVQVWTFHVEALLRTSIKIGWIPYGACLECFPPRVL